MLPFTKTVVLAAKHFDGKILEISNGFFLSVHTCKRKKTEGFFI